MCAQTSTFQCIYRQNNQRGTAQNENIIVKEQEDVDQLNNSLNERLFTDDHNLVCEDKEQLHHHMSLVKVSMHQKKKKSAKHQTH